MENRDLKQTEVSFYIFLLIFTRRFYSRLSDRIQLDISQIHFYLTEFQKTFSLETSNAILLFLIFFSIPNYLFNFYLTTNYNFTVQQLYSNHFQARKNKQTRPFNKNTLARLCSSCFGYRVKSSTFFFLESFK